MKNRTPKDGRPPSELITRQIEELGDWRGQLLAQLRKLILDAAPEVTEEWKWGTAVWGDKGNVVAAGALQEDAQLNFFKSATLGDTSSQPVARQRRHAPLISTKVTKSMWPH